MDDTEKENLPIRPWYERVFETSDLTFSNPELDPYLNVDQYPQWVLNMMAELTRQSLHLSPVRGMAAVTPRKLGMNLGQKCANFYAIANQVITGMENPQNVEKAVAYVEQLENNKENPVAASLLHSMEVTGALIEDLGKEAEEFGKIVHNAFKEALDQSDYAEAVQFFQGFAQGISSPGLKLGKLAQSTEATAIYQKMFFHWQEIDQLPTVTALHDFLLKVGISKIMLGDIDRLRTLCKRIGFAPGKRGRPPKPK
jgi:hypothetical protein